jgi:thymidylate synthase
MRFYKNFAEALNELRRDLKEMGVRVHTKSVQNLDITNNPEYDSMEIQNYTYTVTQPDCNDIPLANAAWCDAEFKERIGGKPLNPGQAWKLRADYWKEFLTPQGTFDYAYPQRLCYTVPHVIELLKKDPFTRRAFIPVFDASKDIVDNLDKRIPCSIGYWLVYRQYKLSITYLQRSSDFSEHFNNDIWLANKLKDYVAEKAGLESGPFIHWLGSLHVFAKDVSSVF